MPIPLVEAVRSVTLEKVEMVAVGIVVHVPIPHGHKPTYCCSPGAHTHAHIRRELHTLSSFTCYLSETLTSWPKKKEAAVVHKGALV